MKKAFFILVVLVMLSLVACGDMGGVGGGQSGKYQWVLVDIQDHDTRQTTEAQEYGDYTYTFTHTADYNRCNYRMRMVYDGETRETAYEKFVHGEAYSVSCVFSEPPEVIGIGEKVTLDFLMKEEENTLSGMTGFASGDATFTAADRGLNASNTLDTKFTDDNSVEEKDRFELATREGTSLIDTEISAIAPTGKKGDRMALRLRFSVGHTVGTFYIYELQKK